jgi:hypothetical protein
LISCALHGMMRFMNARERILTALHHQHPDVIPWTIYQGLLPEGKFAQGLKGKGLAVNVCWASVCDITRPNVKVEESTEGRMIYRKYTTPMGSLTSVHRLTALRPDLQTIWTVEYPVKDINDYSVAEFMVKDQEFIPRDDVYLKQERCLDGQGIVTADTGLTPLQKMLTDFLGYRRFGIDQHRYRQNFDHLYDAFWESCEAMHRIAANSKAEFCHCSDTMNARVISPALFERYFMPFYETVTNILHTRNKMYLVHMDGALSPLKGLIAETKIDVIEAFTPHPLGDLSLAEAREAWKDKIIWVNFPENVFLMGTEETRLFTMALLRQAAPGDDFLLGITEDIEPHIIEESLMAVTETVNKFGVYPLGL